MDRAQASSRSCRLTLLVGLIAGVVGGVGTSYFLFELALLPPLTGLGFFVLILLRGTMLGGGAGLPVGFAYAGWKKLPFRTLVAATVSLLIGSLVIFLPIPFHIPPDIMDLLIVRESQP